MILYNVYIKRQTGQIVCLSRLSYIIIWCILSSFQFRFLIPPYPFIEAFLHLLQKMRVTDGLSPFDVSIESVTVLRFNSKERIEYGSKLFQRDFPVVDASHFMDAVYDFNKVYGIACPL